MAIRKPSKTFKSLDDLFNYMDGIMKEVLESVSKSYLDKLKKYIKTKFYDKHNPTSYIRSTDGEGFLDSLVFEVRQVKRNQYECFIYCDTQLMQVTISEDKNVWNAHADVYGNDVRDGIPIWIDTGNGSSPLYQYAGCGWSNYLYNMVNSHLLTDIKVAMHKKGVTCKNI